MKTVSFTEFRNHASGLISDVENGETVVVLRHGKAVAEVSPVTNAPTRAPNWKRPALKLAMRGVELSAAIIEERQREGVF